MKSNFIISLLFSLLFINTACEELDREALFQNEFRKIIYLKSNGVIDMTLYKTGEDANYQFSVIKTGAYPELTADAYLEKMTDEELKEYCDPRGLNFKILPSSCYDIDNTQFQFIANEGYKLVSLTLHTTTIDEQTDKNSESEYVIPMILKSQNDSINSNMNLIIIKPKVVTPAVEFVNTGLTEKYCANGVTTIQVPLRLQIENKWDFTCKVEIDPTATDGFDQVTKGYTLENNGVVTFTKGNSNATLNITFNRELAEIGQPSFDIPVIPLRIKEISMPTFDVDNKAVQIGISCKYPLTTSMLYTNALEPEEGSLSNLLDGNINTFFHSAWSIDIEGKHYVQVNLPEALPAFRFSYTNRATDGDAAMDAFMVSVSTDGRSFSDLKQYYWDVDNLPGEAAGVFESEILAPDTPIKSIRFTCDSNWTAGPYFVWSEFSLYGF